MLGCMIDLAAWLTGRYGEPDRLVEMSPTRMLYERCGFHVMASVDADGERVRVLAVWPIGARE